MAFITTNTLVTVSPLPVLPNVQATVQATVTPASRVAPFTGYVQFYFEGMLPLGDPVPINADGTATFVTSFPAGEYTLAASYLSANDPNYTGSTSQQLDLIVSAGTPVFRPLGGFALVATTSSGVDVARTFSSMLITPNPASVGVPLTIFWTVSNAASMRIQAINYTDPQYDSGLLSTNPAGVSSGILTKSDGFSMSTLFVMTTYDMQGNVKFHAVTFVSIDETFLPGGGFGQHFGFSFGFNNYGFGQGFGSFFPL